MPNQGDLLLESIGAELPDRHSELEGLVLGDQRVGIDDLDKTTRTGRSQASIAGVAASRSRLPGAAETLRATDFADACPIAIVALEISSSDEGRR